MGNAQETPKTKKDTTQVDKIGTWSVRKMGAPSTVHEPGMKIQVIVGQIEEMEWEAALLTDVKFGTTGVSWVKGPERWWLLIFHGMVAIMLSEGWATWWRSGGCQAHYAAGGNKARAMAVTLPAEGTLKGYHLVVGYSPHSGARDVELERLREQMIRLARKSTTAETLIMGGGHEH